MARNLVAASSQYLEKATAIVTAVPLTLGIWFRPTNVTGGHTAIAISNNSATQSWFALNLSGTNVQAYHYDGSAGGAAQTAGGLATINTWHHLAGVFTSNSSRTAYVDGGSPNTDTTVCVTPSLNATTIGVEYTGAGTRTSYADGDVAEAAIWSAALDAFEIAALGAGVSPLLIRPASLVAYWPLLGQTSPEIDLRGRNELTVTGATASAHCRVYQASSLQTMRWRAPVVTSQGNMFLVF